jgi:hypothetical protein
MPPRRFGRGHHERGELGQSPATGFHEVHGGAEVKGLAKAGLEHCRADSDSQDQQTGIG